MGDKTEVYCDASRVGLSYILVQVRNGERVIITCGSVALTEAQKNYSVTELEALAITHAIGKLAYYLKGMQDSFTVFTDHKPLTTMMQKNICDVVNDRLGRMMEKVAWARFNMVYLPGNKNHIADLLSINPSEEDKAEEIPRHAHLGTVLSDVSVEETTGGELLLMDGTRLFVPKEAREHLIKTLHQTHLSKETMWATARQDWFWVGLKEELRKLEDNCQECQENAISKTKMTPVIPDDVAEMAVMERVAADVFHYRNNKYLTVVDRGSAT